MTWRQPAPTVASTTFEALGTAWWIALNPPPAFGGSHHRRAPEPAPSWWQEAVGAAISWLDVYDATMSRFRSDSTIMQLSTTGGTLAVPEYAREMMLFYTQLEDATDGLINPLSGQYQAASGYGLPSQAPLAGPRRSFTECLSSDGCELFIPAGAILDVGAAGKGLAVDVVHSIMGEYVRTYLPDVDSILVVDGSGDIKVTGGSITIGLENPKDTSQLLTVIEFPDPEQDRSFTAFASSSPARRARGNWHHIISAVTGESMDTLDASWAAADSAMVADGLATALFMTPPAPLERLVECAWAVVLDGKFYPSPRFPTLNKNQ